MNELDKEDGGLGFNAHGGDPDPEPESKRIKLDVDDPNIQHIKENQVDDGSRKPLEEALSDTSTHEQPSETKYVDIVPISFGTDSDVDDGYRKPMEEALSDTSTHEQPSERKYVDGFALIFSTDSDDDDENKKSAHNANAHEHDDRGVDMPVEWDRELAEKGVDIEKLKKEKWPDWQGRCTICGVVDMHPTEKCVYFKLMYY